MRRLLLAIFSHRTLALIRWDLRLLKMRLTNAGRPDLSGRLHLNLGSGPRGLSDRAWLNVDGYRDRNVDHLMDFVRPWPLPCAAFEGIFSEHVLEHFDPEQGLFVLGECFRVLRPGGVIRIIVPDGEKIIGSYVGNRKVLLDHRGTVTGCAMEAINSYFRQRYEHQNMYDFEYLAHQLRASGFVQPVKLAYGGGRDRAVVLDDPAYEWESLYVEAVKP